MKEERRPRKVRKQAGIIVDESIIVSNYGKWVDGGGRKMKVCPFPSKKFVDLILMWLP